MDKKINFDYRWYKKELEEPGFLFIEEGGRDE